MAQQHQLIGLIEIDADPAGQWQDDATLGEALAGLRCIHEETVETAEPPGTVQVLHADLGRLSWELEVELRRFVERLLATT